MPLSSILVLTKNEERNIARCLTAVLRQTVMGESEIILIDSGSTDRTIEIASTFPVEIHCIPAGSFHHARTRNYAASLASKEYLVYLAADAWPATNTWLESLLAPFSDRGVAAVYGRHLPKEGATAERRATLATVYGEKQITKDMAAKRDLGYRCYHLSTVNAALRREAWSATKFPEEVKVFEDVAIGKRLIDGGWKIVYEPRAAVYHSHNHSSDALFKRYFDLGVTWRRLGIWDAEVRASLVRDALRLVSGGKRPAAKDRRQSSRYSSLSLAGAKCLGISLGLNERLLPLSIKKKLSAFQLFD